MGLALGDITVPSRPTSHTVVLSSSRSIRDCNLWPKNLLGPLQVWNPMILLFLKHKHMEQDRMRGGWKGLEQDGERGELSASFECGCIISLLDRTTPFKNLICNFRGGEGWEIHINTAVIFTKWCGPERMSRQKSSYWISFLERNIPLTYPWYKKKRPKYNTFKVCNSKKLDN